VGLDGGGDLVDAATRQQGVGSMPMADISEASFSPRAASPGELFSMPDSRLRHDQFAPPAFRPLGATGAARPPAVSNTERNSSSVAVGVRRRRGRWPGSSAQQIVIGRTSGGGGVDGWGGRPAVLGRGIAAKADAAPASVRPWRWPPR
jgi:hypothetical protein